jgi:hypothetical protein
MYLSIVDGFPALKMMCVRGNISRARTYTPIIHPTGKKQEI